MSAVHATLARLEEPRLTNQRYVVSENKKEEISKLALGAKLERALNRRMSGQDASFTKKKEGAKQVKAAAAWEAAADGEVVVWERIGWDS